MTIKGYDFDREPIPPGLFAKMSHALANKTESSVIPGFGDDCVVTTSGLNVTVATGLINCYGRFIELIGPEVVIVPPNTSGHIVVEIDLTKENESIGDVGTIDYVCINNQVSVKFVTDAEFSDEDLVGGGTLAMLSLGTVTSTGTEVNYIRNAKAYKSSWPTLGSTINVADFIIEQSENRDPTVGWVWEKYASGSVKARCITTTSCASGSKYPDSSGWYHGYTPSFDYPQELFVNGKAKFATADIISHPSGLISVDKALITAGNKVQAQLVAPMSALNTLAIGIVYSLDGIWTETPPEVLTNLLYTPQYISPTEFVYTTAKKDTGRTYKDPTTGLEYIIWGQLVDTTITVVANTEASILLPYPKFNNAKFKILDYWGHWDRGNGDYVAIPCARGTIIYATLLHNVTSFGFQFLVKSNYAMTNASVHIFLDYIDDTLRPS